MTTRRPTGVPDAVFTIRWEHRSAQFASPPQKLARDCGSTWWGNDAIPPGYWLNPPSVYQAADDCITLMIDPGTDFWQRTHYGFQNNNAHAYLWKTEKNFTSKCAARFDYKVRFDQAGVFVWVDQFNWIKVSLGYEDESLSSLGAVVTNNGYLDWTTRIAKQVGSFNTEYLKADSISSSRRIRAATGNNCVCATSPFLVKQRPTREPLMQPTCLPFQSQLVSIPAVRVNRALKLNLTVNSCLPLPRNTVSL